MKNKNLLMIIILFILVFVIITIMPDYSLGYGNVGKIYISEVMAKNTFTTTDDDGDFSDWIEIYNGNDKEINLKGYTLSDNELNPSKWTFPSVKIKAKSYLVVYASGKNRCVKDVCHTNFKLNDTGERITLNNKSGDTISKVTYGKVDNDVSYGIIKKSYGYMKTPTPGKENKGKIYSTSFSRKASDIEIRINEYMTKNKRTTYDEDGDYSNWIELYNYGKDDIKLKGFMLSDNEKKLGKYKFGDITLKSNEYLLIYASGKTNKSKSKEIHTGFTLSTGDSVVILADKEGNVIDKVSVIPLNDDVSYGLKDDEWVYFSTATPGSENNTQALEKDEAGVLKKKIIINEVETVNSEWIELKNISNENISLKGYKIKDKSGSTYKFGNVTINKGSYYTITNKINLGNSKEELFLYDDKNRLVDSFEVGRQVRGVSSGIGKDGNRVFYKEITKNRSNSSTEYIGYASEVKFSKDGGYISKGKEVKLSTKDGSTIYYTLDGSTPNKSSKKYTNPIKINSTTVVKAISYKKNHIQSDVTSRTFFVGRKHKIAVVSLSTNSNNLFGGGGIYTHYRLDKEAPISFEFYENDGTFGVMFNGGTKLVGQDSREFPQKSMAIYLRKKYGKKEVEYPFFTGHKVTTFGSFTLRNSGEDTAYMKIKDAFLTETLNGQMDIDMQKYRPVAVYINGKYWGLYNIREKLNEDYLKNNHGVDPDKVDLIKGNNDVKSGSMKNYNALLKYLRTHDMTSKKNYEYIKTIVDVQELANYWIVETYYRNVDSGNIRFWRERSSTGKWRWMLFDLDWAMYPTTYGEPALNFITKPYGHGVGNWFSTDVTYYLFKNKDFKDLYLKSFAYHLKNTFKPERMNKILDRIVDEVKDEMPYHINRWKSYEGQSSLSSMNVWYSRIKIMKEVVKDRYKIVVRSLKSQFNLSDKQYKKYFGDL